MSPMNPRGRKEFGGPKGPPNLPENMLIGLTLIGLF
jgi:hypothetical protein